MPTFNADTIAEETRIRIPKIAGAQISVEALAGDGSDRAYYRLRVRSRPGHSDGAGEEQTLLFMRFQPERPENLAFAPLSAFLRSWDIACPDILACDEHRHLIWLEDLGDRDLWSFRHEPWDKIRRPLYQSALAEVHKIHSFTEEKFSSSMARPEILQPHFDDRLYQWEQDYFFTNFVPHFSAVTPATADELRRHPCLLELATQLSSHPRTLVHRDFQSRNVIIRERQAYLIDYQGMRFGLPQYDLASLLCDPYVSITPEQRDALLDDYDALGGPRASVSREERRELFWGCAGQRLMQALGAYGFLGIRKQKRHFLDSIPHAVENLLTVLEHRPQLEPLRPLLKLKSDLAL